MEAKSPDRIGAFCYNLHMLRWLKTIRYIVLISSILLAILVWVIGSKVYAPITETYSEVGKIYAILAVCFLYASLLTTPLYFNFKRLPGKVLYVKARRALGVSAFMFAWLHASIEFFKVYGGFKSLKYLANQYLWGFSFSSLALLILTLMAFTSIDPMVKLMGKYWKPLHRLVYIAAFAVVMHVLLISPNPLFFFAAAALFALESFRFDEFVTKRFTKLSQYSVAIVLNVLMLAALFWWCIVGFNN